MRQIYTEEQKKEIYRLWETDNYNKVELGKHLNMPTSTVSKFLLQAGYPCPVKGSWKRKYNVIHDYFETIDSEQKAYILGFLYADGYNNEKKGIIQVKLHKQDIDILEQMSAILQPEREMYIKSNGTSTEMYINSRKLSQDLAKWGCTQKKSLTLKFPTFLSDDLIPHFIRGYFDGDGCVYCNSDKRIFSFQIIGTKHMIDQIQQYLIDKCHFNVTKIMERKSQHNDNMFYIVGYSGIRSVLNFREILYKDATIFLKRKYDKFFSVPSPMRKEKRKR